MKRITLLMSAPGWTVIDKSCHSLQYLLSTAHRHGRDQRDKKISGVLIKGRRLTRSPAALKYVSMVYSAAADCLVTRGAGCGLNAEVWRIHFKLKLFLLQAPLGSSRSLSWTQVTRNSEQHFCTVSPVDSLPPTALTLSHALLYLIHLKHFFSCFWVSMKYFASPL